MVQLLGFFQVRLIHALSKIKLIFFYTVLVSVFFTQCASFCFQTSVSKFQITFMTMFTLYLRFPFQGKMFARRVLSKCWDGILDVLSVLLNGKSSCGISSSLGLLLGTEGAKEESLRAQEAICTSLNGLQKAARLCCTLGTIDSLLYTSTYCISAIQLYFSESIKL